MIEQTPGDASGVEIGGTRRERRARFVSRLILFANISLTFC